MNLCVDGTEVPAHAEQVMKWLHEADTEEQFGVKTTEAPFY